MSEEIMMLRPVIQDQLRGRENLTVLEAGCGEANYGGYLRNAHFTGIDISEKQLDRNKVLHKKIVGDIQKYRLPENAFDAIFCWNVLEHLSNPGAALRNFQNALRQNGIMVLAMPNVLSLKGLVTKLTPHWVHVWLYRKVKGNPNAGKDDTGPFRTFLRFSLSPSLLRRFARQHGLSIEFFHPYESAIQRKTRQKYRFVNRVLRWTRRATLGRLWTFSSDFIIVLKKASENGKARLVPDTTPYAG